MNFLGHLRYYAGILLIIFGLFLTFGGVVKLNEGTETWQSFLSLSFFVGVLPVLTGAWLVYSAQTKGKKLQKEKNEKEILHFALKAGGNITIAQAAMLTSLSASEVEIILMRMQEQGIFVLKVSENGHIVYQVAGMLKQGEQLHDI
jgi:hypothetical protein